MTDHDDVLRELNEALNVEPSPEFADGVRARVVRSRVRIRRMGWGLAAAASVTLAATMWWPPAVESPATGVPQEVVASGPAAGEAQAAVVSKEAMEPESVVARETPVPPVARRVAAVASSAAASGPRLVVITNQGAILRELWAEYGTQAMEEIVVERAEPAALAEMKPPTPITVDPIVVAPIVLSDLGSTGERGGGAAPVIRRIRATEETR